MNKKINILSLFSWCWWMDLGFKMAWFKINLANDIMKDACNTLRKNFKETEVIEWDITDKDIKNWIYSFFNNKEVDVIIWWPPCQAYSMAWKRDICDKRWRLFEDYIEIVTELKPKVCIMENVKWILSIRHLKKNIDIEEQKEVFDLYEKLKNSKTSSEKKELNKLLDSHKEPVIKQIIEWFNNAWYNVEYKLLNSADYWVAQKRERVIFIAKRNNIDIKITHPKPIFNKDNYKTVFETIDDLKNHKEDYGFGHIYTKHSDDFLEKIKNTPIWESVLWSYSDAFFRLYPNLPSRTVKENHWWVFIHYDKNRVMTPRECARLQSFPDDFIFTWTKSKMLVQIWNAVPPLMAKSIAENLKIFFEELASLKEKQCPNCDIKMIDRMFELDKTILEEFSFCNSCWFWRPNFS